MNNTEYISKNGISLPSYPQLEKKENILKNLPKLMTYLDADAIICTDDFSRKVYRLFNEGKTEEET